MDSKSRGLSKATDALVQQDASIGEKESRGVRAIHQAIWDHHHSVTQLLLDESADFTVEIDSLEPIAPFGNNYARIPTSSGRYQRQLFLRETDYQEKKGELNVQAR